MFREILLTPLLSPWAGLVVLAVRLLPPAGPQSPLQPGLSSEDLSSGSLAPNTHNATWVTGESRSHTDRRYCIIVV